MQLHSFTQEQLETDTSYQLLSQSQVCCKAISFVDYLASKKSLVYHCEQCDTEKLDCLGFTPLFVADWITQLTLQHYEIPCPYCTAPAYCVGGGLQEGLHFVCAEACHVSWQRTIRRY